MVLCTACGNQVEESASFCTSCGKPMPAGAQPSSAVTVTQLVCSSCGAQADPGYVFCTECGKPLTAQSVPTQAAPASSAAEAVAASPAAFCTNCGSKLEAGTGFCTNCGQPVAGSSPDAVPAEPPAPISSQPNEPVTPPVVPKPTVAPSRSDPAASAPGAVPIETTPAAATTAKSPVEPPPLQPAPQVAAPIYATPNDYPPAQPGAGAFRMIVLVLLLVIVIGGFGGLYFMGVETVVVCSPPDVTVFLDGKELAPTSHGRYVIPHLSRQPHQLRVQRAGFADTIERLDFPLMSLHEWVNIKLVPHRPARSSSPR